MGLPADGVDALAESTTFVSPRLDHSRSSALESRFGKRGSRSPSLSSAGFVMRSSTCESVRSRSSPGGSGESRGPVAMQHHLIDNRNPTEMHAARLLNHEVG